jgi:hypothetical protein
MSQVRCLPRQNSPSSLQLVDSYQHRSIDETSMGMSDNQNQVTLAVFSKSNSPATCLEKLALTTKGLTNDSACL